MAQLLDTVIAARCQSTRRDMIQAKRQLRIQAALVAGGTTLALTALLGILPPFITYAGFLVAAGSLLWWLAGTPKSRRTFHAEWCRAELPWLRLQSILVDLPEDWAIFQHGGIPILAGPPGAVALAPGADLPGECDHGIRELMLASLNWADSICRSARLPGEPLGLLVHEDPRAGPESGRIGTVTLSRLSMYLLEMPRVWSPSDLRAFVAGAAGTLSETRTVWTNRPTRTSGGRKGRAFGRLIRKLSLAFAVLLAGAALIAGISLVWPSGFARIVYSGQNFLSSRLPESWAQPLRIPVVVNFGNDRINGTIIHTCDAAERVGGGRTAGRLKRGESVSILDQAFAGDSEKSPWLYVRSSSAEGWVVQTGVTVSYLPAGMKYFMEPDERLGDAQAITVDTPAVLTRRREIAGKGGSIWWEFWAPGARRGWIHSDTNPLCRG